MTSHRTRLFHSHQTPVSGFTLVEMAMVLLVLGILMRAAIVPLSGSYEHRQRSDTAQQLENIRESLIAHVLSTGALPCPLPSKGTAGNSPVSNSGSSVGTPSGAAFGITKGLASSQYSACKIAQGGVPAVLLGIPGPINADGALIDSWNRPFRYAVSLNSHAERGIPEAPDWTTPGEAASVGVYNLSADIIICNRATQRNCAGRDVRAAQVAFVVLSSGRHNLSRGIESENQDDDSFFLMRPESQLESTQFDDQLVWATTADLIYWLLRIGWLP